MTRLTPFRKSNARFLPVITALGDARVVDTGARSRSQRLSLHVVAPGAATMSEVKTRDVRGTIHDDPESVYLMDHPDSTEKIPTLDISPYLKGEPGGREAVAARLREISMTVGFFYLKGHGVPQRLLERMFAEAKRFHS